MKRIEKLKKRLFESDFLIKKRVVGRKRNHFKRPRGYQKANYYSKGPGY